VNYPRKNRGISKLTLFKITHASVPNAFVSHNYELVNVFAIIKLQNVKFYWALHVMLHITSMIFMILKITWIKNQLFRLGYTYYVKLFHSIFKGWELLKQRTTAWIWGCELRFRGIWKGLNQFCSCAFATKKGHFCQFFKIGTFKISDIL